MAKLDLFFFLGGGGREWGLIIALHCKYDSHLLYKYTVYHKKDKITVQF